jgi:hypothetical protein
MNEHKKFYDYAFELFNSQSQINSMTTFSTLNSQFPFYKHYYEDNPSKNQTSSGTFYKNKRVALK